MAAPEVRSILTRWQCGLYILTPPRMFTFSNEGGSEAPLMRGMPSFRWAFRFGGWNPTQEQWTLAAQCVQPEEKARIGKFMFKKDSKAALAGRLLLRKVICETLSVPYKDVKLARTEKGKPYLEKPILDKYPNFNFNVSHQGDYAVLAAETVHLVGIDVMKVEYPSASRGVGGFFDTMSRQFTYHEWKVIKSTNDEHQQLARFYRFWCLKESYVKALGMGIGFELQRLSFDTPTLTLAPGVITLDTRVFVDDEIQPDWKFEETMLDDNHYVAVALQKNKDVKSNLGDAWPSDEGMPANYQMLSFDDLMTGAQPLSEPDLVYWEKFESRQERPGRVTMP